MTGPPAEADVVIIGGGVIGLSTAYHLASAGVERVVLLERGALGEGSTCSAAGGVRALFSDEINIALGLRSLDAFDRFSRKFGQEIDLHQVGYLFLFDDEDDAAVFAANTELQNAMGVESRMISADEAKQLSPLINIDDVVGALWSPQDGHCTPESVVQGYARAARDAGARLLTGCPATGVETDGDRVTAVNSGAGRIATDSIVVAAGAWSGEIGALAGVEMPVKPLRRQIAVTGGVAGLRSDTPFTIDFSTSFYFHNEGSGLLLGMPEPQDSWSFDLSRDQAWISELAEIMARRMPALEDVGIASGWAGLYEMTPDHNALIGRSRHMPGVLYACGFSGHGFLMGPAVGEVVRDLYLRQKPVIDVSALDVERFANADIRPELNIV